MKSPAARKLKRHCYTVSRSRDLHRKRDCSARSAGGFRNRFVLSPELWELYGREPVTARVRSSFWYECLHPSDRKRVESIMSECWQGRRPFADCDFRIVTPRSEIRWIHCRVSFQYDDAGSPRLAVAINIT